MICLTPDELERITGYRQPAAQLAELHRQGFCRARRNPAGLVTVERSHYEAVCQGVQQPARPRVNLDGPYPCGPDGLPSAWLREHWRTFVFSREHALAHRIKPESAPVKSGVYVLWCSEELVYVGESSCVSRRLIQHGRKQFDSLFTFPVPAIYRKAIECAYIDALRPPANRDVKKSTMPKLRAEIRALWGV